MLVKKFLGRDENSRFVSKVFDSTIRRYEYKWKVDFLEIRAGTEKIVIDDNSVKIFINMKDPFILNMDEKATSIIILRLLNTVLVRKVFGQVPKYLEDLLVFREIIKQKGGDDLYYYFYLSLMEHRPHVIKDFRDFLDMNLYWLSFAGYDEYNADSMKNLINALKYNKEFENKCKNFFKPLTKDLWNQKNLDRAVKAYNKVTA